MDAINPTPDGHRELEAFLEALQSTPPDAMTACDGWTAHELVSHLAAGAAEVAATLEAYAEGGPVPPTRGFEEREAPYRAMADPELRRTFGVAGERKAAALAKVLSADPDAVVAWMGRKMPVIAFVAHARSELALHRWDLVGDDPTSLELLAQTELTVHAVMALGRVLPARGAAQGRGRLRVTLGSPGAPDVVLACDGDGTRLELADEGSGAPAIIADPAARLLLLWGRRPNDPGRVRVPGGSGLLGQVQGVLAGY